MKHVFSHIRKSVSLKNGLVVTTLLLLSCTAFAQSACGFFDSKVKLADDSSLCIKDIPFFNRTGIVTSEPKASYASIAAANPFSFAVAATADPKLCPFASIISRNFGNGLDAAEAIKSCDTKLQQAVQTIGKSDSNVQCKCQILIDNSRKSPLDRQAFNERMNQFEIQISSGNKPLKGTQIDIVIAENKKKEEEQRKREDENKKQQEEDERKNQKDQEARSREREEENKRRPRPSVPTTTTPRVGKLSASALVIGNSNYVNYSKLPNSVNDARDIAKKLASFGIEVDLVLDADRDKLVRALNLYKGKATGKDVSLLFYAGHGQEWEGENYVIPTNMSKDGITPGYIKLNAIGLTAMMDYLPSKTKLVFLDSCRERPPSEVGKVMKGSSNFGFSPVTAATGTMIAYATAPGKLAADGNGKNSPYTTALLEHIDTPIDIRILMGKVRQTVLQITANAQEPWESISLTGEQFILSQMSK